MSVQITGQVAFINQPVTNGNFTSQSIIIVVDPGQYQSLVQLDFSGERMAQVANLQVNLTYTFTINVRGSKQMFPSTKTPGLQIAYNTLSVWKTEAAVNQSVPVNNQPAQPQYQQPQQPVYNQQPVQQGGYVGAPQPQQPVQQQMAQPQQQYVQPQPQQYAQPQQPAQQPVQNFPQQGQQMAQPPQQAGFPQQTAPQQTGQPTTQGFPVAQTFPGQQ